MPEFHPESYDELLDVTGLTCPLPVLRAQKHLREACEGTIVKVIATDPVTAIDVPHFCQESGHQLLDSGTTDDTLFFYIKCVKRPD